MDTEKIIRIWGDEYANIPYTKDGDLFAHFNLERTIVEVGKSYQLPRILEHGHLDADGSETLPVLGFENIYQGELLEVRNNIPYEELEPKDFENSMSHIRNVDELKKAILKRYRASKPFLTDEEILAKGVSRMLLRLSRVS